MRTRTALVRELPSIVSPAIGERITVRGDRFGIDCNDTGRRIAPLGAPQTDIRIQVSQNGVAIPIGTVDANDRYTFGTQVTIPETLAPGPVTLGSTSSGTATQPLAMNITAANPDPGTAPAETTNVSVDPTVERDDPWPWPAALTAIAIGAAGAATTVVIRTRARGSNEH
jgi:hypothetical protein